MNLTQHDIARLQQAYAFLQSGDAASADSILSQLAAARVHPDGLHLHALVLHARGRLGEARSLLEKAIGIVPVHPQYLNSYANLLDDLGEDALAIASFERAIAADPNAIETRINLGLVQTKAGLHDAAQATLDGALAIDPNHPRAWNAKGQLDRAMGNPEEAAQSYGRALEINPADTRARHNRAAALRDADEAEAALAEIELALSGSAALPESPTLRGHLLAELGRFEEAVDQYRSVIATYPGHLDAQETLASLLPQLGRAGEALGGYDAALAQQSGDANLWRSALASARALKQPEAVLRWADAAENAVGPQLDFALARAWALGASGQKVAARDHLLSLLPAHQNDAGLAAYLSHAFIATGDPKAAEVHALRATQLAPLDQTGWSHLSIIWRLLGDPREEWLADYDRLVMPCQLEAPSGYAGLDDFVSELAQTLTGFHTTLAHPAEQSLRGGTQTRGNLFNRRHPDIQALLVAIASAAQRSLSALPDDPTHPFLSRKAEAIQFAGSWSVRLRSEGFHIAHIHPQGWLSSACYIALPPEVGGDDNAGALQLGVPDSDFGLDLTPRRIVRPAPGKLVLFPSYFWHGTLPFESESARLTVAFDALPRSA